MDKMHACEYQIAYDTLELHSKDFSQKWKSRNVISNMHDLIYDLNALLCVNNFNVLLCTILSKQIR